MSLPTQGDLLTLAWGNAGDGDPYAAVEPGATNVAPSLAWGFLGFAFEPAPAGSSSGGGGGGTGHKRMQMMCVT
jgi:hypothetical protein